MATDTEKVRVLIPDTEAVFDGETLFSDDDIIVYLEIAGNNVLRAASYAVLAMATSEAIISKVIRTQDLQTNGATLAEALRKHAEFLRLRAEDSENFYFGVVYPDYDPVMPELTEFSYNYWLNDPGYGNGGYGN